MNMSTHLGMTKRRKLLKSLTGASVAVGTPILTTNSVSGKKSMTEVRSQTERKRNCGGTLGSTTLET
jgi:hypothetical protein